ncbi:MAG: hypothetical protein ACREQJ_16975, partial [Candidatus Binatia bacterium]
VCDNCPDEPNLDQADSDGDALGDVCDGFTATTSVEDAGTTSDPCAPGEPCWVRFTITKDSNEAGKLVAPDCDVNPYFTLECPGGHVPGTDRLKTCSQRTVVTMAAAPGVVGDVRCDLSQRINALRPGYPAGGIQTCDVCAAYTNLCDDDPDAFRGALAPECQPVTFGGTPAVSVEINVKAPTINAELNGIVAVEIMNSATFDPSTVDVLSTKLIADGLAFKAVGMEAVPGDLDNDGDKDLMVKMKIVEVPATGGDVTLIFTGKAGSQTITGQDTARINK